MYTLEKESGPAPERRGGLIALAGILVSFLIVASGQAQAKPFCPCWEDETGQPGLTATMDAFVGGETAFNYKCAVNNQAGSRSFSFQRTGDGGLFEAATHRLQKRCWLKDPDMAPSPTRGGQIAKCNRDIKAACAQFAP